MRVLIAEDEAVSRAVLERSPYDARELDLRLRTGLRVVSLHQQLATKVGELERALGQVKQLEGILPICMHCKKIRDGEQQWQQVEEYIATHSTASFSHGICSSCFDEHYPEEVAPLPLRRVGT